MIESIGYTGDGQVWVRMVLEVNGQGMTGTLMLKPAFARDISQKLIEAAEKAETAVPDVRNSANTH
jgi:hypothetical protein